MPLGRQMIAESYKMEAVLVRMRASAVMNTLAKKSARDGRSECIMDDIIKVAELSRRKDGTKRLEIIPKCLLRTWR